MGSGVNNVDRINLDINADVVVIANHNDIHPGNVTRSNFINNSSLYNLSRFVLKPEINVKCSLNISQY